MRCSNTNREGKVCNNYLGDASEKNEGEVAHCKGCKKGTKVTMRHIKLDRIKNANQTREKYDKPPIPVPQFSSHY
jgi:hypothetical protein